MWMEKNIVINHYNIIDCNIRIPPSTDWSFLTSCTCRREGVLNPPLNILVGCVYKSDPPVHISILYVPAGSMLSHIPSTK